MEAHFVLKGLSKNIAYKRNKERRGGGEEEEEEEEEKKEKRNNITSWRLESLTFPHNKCTLELCYWTFPQVADTHNRHLKLNLTSLQQDIKYKGLYHSTLCFRPTEYLTEHSEAPARFLFFFFKQTKNALNKDDL